MTKAQHCPCHLELFTELLGAIRPCQELPWLGVPGYLTATASVQLCVCLLYKCTSLAGTTILQPRINCLL